MPVGETIVTGLIFFTQSFEKIQSIENGTNQVKKGFATDTTKECLIGKVATWCGTVSGHLLLPTRRHHVIVGWHLVVTDAHADVNIRIV